MTNLKDLSKHLGLSVTQVSRALNGYSDVAEATRERVKKAAEELNYQPNLSARKLAKGRSGMVAIVRRHYDDMTRDPTFLHVATGLSLEFAKREMQLVLHVSPRDQNPVEIHKKLYAGGAIDGFVILEPSKNDPRIAYLQNQNIPFVVHGRAELSPDHAYFDIDNIAVGYDLAKHLINLGHKKILFINGFADRGYSVLREQGFQKAIAEAELDPQSNPILNQRMTEQSGHDLAMTHIVNAPNPPSAVICGHMRIAKGVYDALAKNNISIPNDISIAAHDDLIQELPANGFAPPITISRAAIQDSWVPLSQFMERAINGEPIENLQEIEPVQIILGQSTVSA